MITRFAPSPTGPLHLGHAYSAVLAHDLARANFGGFMVRIEDIDAGRTRAAFVDGIFVDLAWLGLAYDGDVLRQSTRMGAYRDALEGLIARGLAYPCFCTRADIAQAASAPHGPEGALYPGICRGLAAEVRAQRMADEPHAWRLDLARALAEVASPLAWIDAGAGDVVATPELLGDVVLARKDTGVAYHLAVVVDDAAQAVTDVVRGADLFAATHVHRLLQALIGLPTPRYHHHALLADDTGRRLAKRDGAKSLAALRDAGADPAEIVAMLRAKGFQAGADAPIFGTCRPSSSS